MNVWVHRRMVVIVLGVAFGLALIFALSRASSAASPNGVPPEPFGFSNIEQNLCDFPVLVEADGKLKDIEKPDGRIISVAPGLSITMTNQEESENQITVSDSGVYHVTPLPDDEELWAITGTVFLLFDADFTEELQQGIYLVHGRTTFVQDAEGNWDPSKFGIEGQVTDVCATLG
jgi:hypothetical protein